MIRKDIAGLGYSLYCDFPAVTVNSMVTMPFKFHEKEGEVCNRFLSFIVKDLHELCDICKS